MSRLDEHRRWRADLAAYLLGSLEPDETAALQLHLEDCLRCRDELDWLRPAIDVIPDSIPQLDPPKALRARLLAEVRSDAADAAVSPAHETKLRRRGPRPGGLRGFLLRPATALAVVALVVAASVGYELRGNGESTKVFHSRGGSIAKATLKQNGDSGTLHMVGLRQLPSSQVYEAWVQHGKRVERSSLFEAESDGTANASVPLHLKGANQVMVTVEPSHGTDRPTSAAIVSVPLSG